MKDFWTHWRHEIVRGRLLFVGVVAVGLLSASGFPRVVGTVIPIRDGLMVAVKVAE